MIRSADFEWLSSESARVGYIVATPMLYNDVSGAAMPASRLEAQLVTTLLRMA
jgi:hypothetical protein